MNDVAMCRKISYDITVLCSKQPANNGKALTTVFQLNLCAKINGLSWQTHAQYLFKKFLDLDRHQKPHPYKKINQNLLIIC